MEDKHKECYGKPRFYMEGEKGIGVREEHLQNHQHGALERRFRTARANQRPSLKKQNKHQNIMNGARKLLSG